MKASAIRSYIAASIVAATCVVLRANGAQTTPTQPVPQDVPYPGVLTINVNLTDAPNCIYRVHESIPVKPGPFTFYYPKWPFPDHAPDGPIANIAGLVITAKGNRLRWQRDLRDMYTFHVDVPAGANLLDFSFQYLSTEPADGEPVQSAAWWADAVWSTPNLVDVAFTQVAFYPAGYYTRDILIQPTVALPVGWKFATALAVATQSGNVTHFKPISFNNFIDSPLIAGKYFNRVDIAPKAKTPVHLDVVGDSADDVQVSAKETTEYRTLVKQLYALFDSHHYDHYDLLLTLSDYVPPDGLEHHQSSDNRTSANFLTDHDAFVHGASLLPHEFTHSWNGKFRRPAGLWTPNFNMVEQDNLVWVYEGLTEYWASVLTARSGMWTSQQYRQSLAYVAATMTHRTGRNWRSLQDVVNAEQLLYHNGSYWHNYRRDTDFYPEGLLLWLDVDTKIRQLSHDRHSLDDFAKLFYSMDNGSYVTKTYTFQDVVDALNEVQPFDWTKFLRTRLDYTGTNLPEHGIKRGGWKLVYTDKPSEWGTVNAKLAGHAVDLAYSIGFSVTSEGGVYDVQWNGPAFMAGLVPGMKIIAVNGRNYSSDAIKNAIEAASGSKTPIALLVKHAGEFSTLKIDYYGGLKYPHLVREKGTPDLIGEIIAARK
ncbi:MAG: M61 family metallopeptidase [Rhodanobacteraceae bacterium]